MHLCIPSSSNLDKLRVIRSSCDGVTEEMAVRRGGLSMVDERA